MISSGKPSAVSIFELVEALMLFDEPMLNSRYHAMLLRRRTGGEPSAELAALPGFVLEAARLGRDGASRWQALAASDVPDADFVAWAEHTVLDGFLTLAEEQLRVITTIARRAPNLQCREPFDAMAGMHRQMATTLRGELRRLPRREVDGTDAGIRGVQEEDPSGDFRGQLERAVHAAAERGTLRRILVSHTGLRHLRDQGLFKAPSLFGYPVTVDLGWDAPAFVLETYDQVPLEEIMSA